MREPRYRRDPSGDLRLRWERLSLPATRCRNPQHATLDTNLKFSLPPSIPAEQLRWGRSPHLSVVAEQVNFAEWVLRELGLTHEALRAENEPSLAAMRSERG